MPEKVSENCIFTNQNPQEEYFSESMQMFCIVMTFFSSKQFHRLLVSDDCV